MRAIAASQFDRILARQANGFAANDGQRLMVRDLVWTRVSSAP
jgi:hypothetical protein